MYFVSELAGKKLVRARKELFSQASGEKIGVQGSVWLNLERGVAPDWAVEEATKKFRFAMRPTPGSIGGADVPVSQWCVYVDTVEWQERFNHSDEVREACEALLLSSPDMMRVEPPVLRPPWPNYDKLTVQGRRLASDVAKQNLETAAEIGVPVEQLIEYEVAKLNRESVVAAYEAAIFTLKEDELASIAVEA
jgi:hypothetical protein